MEAAGSFIGVPTCLNAKRLLVRAKELGETGPSG